MGEARKHGIIRLARWILTSYLNCWGYGGDGELGNGTMTNSDVPVAVTGIADAKAVVSGSQFGDYCAPQRSSPSTGSGRHGTSRPRVVSVLVSFNPVRHRSPVAALIVSAQVTDADGRW
jgi:Regulator of chromosome condensation (RCC1) repeat